MTSLRKRSLCFVTWNIRGIKNPPGNFSRALNLLRSFRVDIVFIQETRVGPDCVRYFEPDCILENVDETGKKWKVFFTVHNSRSKGVAILIRENVKFEYICHDEDCSGGYIVLFCRLNGELYTLVNVYNHKADRTVLARLKEYLMRTAEGVLVVGGDFNTVLDPSVDREPSSSTNGPLIHFLNEFTSSLSIRDTWSCKHSNHDGQTRFTRKQGNSCSRLDMFFLPENAMEWVRKIKVVTNDTELQSISDHYPLLLKLKVHMPPVRKPPDVVTSLKTSACRSDWTSGKISGAEIVSAWKSLFASRSDWTSGKISGAEIVSASKSLPATEVHRPVEVTYVRCEEIHNSQFTNGELWRSWTETLKTKYNDVLSQRVRTNIGRLEDRPYIFSEILAKRLDAFISFEEKCDIGVIVIFERSPQKIRWSFLEKIFQRLDNFYEEKRSKYAAFAPEPKFAILNHLLPKTESSPGGLRYLQSGCPLTNAILSLALDDLDRNVKSMMKCKTTVCYHKQSLFIHTHQSEQKKVVGLVETFKNDSGVLLTYK